jgi:sulfite reductase (NADPH) hemoprotein beta-component
MYTYSPQETTFLHSRADQFNNQVARFTSNKLKDEEFQQLRLRNGLYMERHAPMLRVAIPYGQLNAGQMRMLGHVAQKYDRGYGHFTTRQNIQFNWIETEQVPALLHELATVGMHAIQTSGSCIRNITTDHLAGVASDEYTDPRPWCELLRQWSTLHPEFNWLPRKFKIAINGAREDRAAIQFHDIGIHVYLDANQQTRFKIYVGGGLGRTPVIGKVIHHELAPENLLHYLQAILRVYNKYGRRDNKYKARIKILVNDLGIDNYRSQVEQMLDAFRQSTTDFDFEEFEKIRRQFDRAPEHSAPGGRAHEPGSIHTNRSIPVASPKFLNWRKHNTTNHSHDGFTVVHVSLKGPGYAPGDLDAESMIRLADIAENLSGDEIRVTHEQNLILPWVRTDQLYEVWSQLSKLKLATPNIGHLTDMIACPGLDFCSLANASTIPLVKEIGDRVSGLDRLYDIGKIKLKMSGCMNACGHHHVGDIGILGVDKKGSEWYQITLGGNAGNNSSLGERLGRAVPKHELADAIETILNTYLAYRMPGESFSQTLGRTGVTPFKRDLYEPAEKSTDYPQPVAA